MRYARLALNLTTAAVMVMPLGGCIMSDHYSVPMTGSMVGYADPATAPVGPTYAMNGSTLADASHAVQRYLSAHYPQAELVRIHALMVGTNAKIDQTSNWEFTYRVQVAAPAPLPTPAILPASVSATASYRAQAVVPTTFNYRLLKFTYTGKAQLLAPVEQDDTGDSLASVDFSRTLLLDEAIATALDIGMGVGAPGMEVTLRPTVNGGAVYELDSSVATKATTTARSTQRVTTYDEWEYTYTTTKTYATPTPAPYYYDDSNNYGKTYATPRPVASPTPSVRYVRGKYLIDAYTGAIIDRPTNL